MTKPDKAMHERHVPLKYSDRTTLVLVCIALACAGAFWIRYSCKQSDVPLFTLSKTDALATADKYIQKKQITLLPGTQILTAPANSSVSAEAKFVYQTSGKEQFKQLYGTYIAPVEWAVRYATFEGDIIERTHEYTLLINNANIVERAVYQVPETLAGATLSESEARARVHQHIKHQFGLSLADLKEISAQSYKKPARTDWLFIVQDITVQLQEGQARIAVEIAGDLIKDTRRFVHVPEAWQRAQEKKNNHISLLLSVCFALFVALLIIGLGFGIKELITCFNVRYFLVVAVLLALNTCYSLWNILPTYYYSFSTAQSFSEQATALILGILSNSVPLLIITAALVVTTYVYFAPGKKSRSLSAIMSALIWGAATELVLSALLSKNFAYVPAVPSSLYLTAMSPHGYMISVSIITFIRTALCCLPVYIIMQKIVTNPNSLQGKGVLVLLSLLAGAGLSCGVAAQSIGILLGVILIQALFVYISYLYIFGADVGLWVAYLAGQMVIQTLYEAYFNGAVITPWWQTVAILTSISFLCAIWFKKK